MRRVLQVTFAAVLLAAPLGGCASFQAILHPSDTQAQLYAEKALIVAHDLHDALALAASAAANSNACVSTCAVEVKKYLDDSAAILAEADKVSDAVTIMAKIEAARVLIHKAQELL